MLTNLFKKTFILLLISCYTFTSSAQVESPYKTDLYKDGAWLIGGFGLSALGLSIIKNKDSLSLAQVNALDKNDIWAVDRWAAGNHSESAAKISDIPFITSFALPFAYLFNKDTKGHAGQLAVLYLESLSTTAALFTITAGLVDKSRPEVYDESLPFADRSNKNAQRSFYSGHVAATATATFFAAQVFSDFFPDSKAKPYIWAGASLIPAVVGYYRIESGNHFLTDNLIGFAMGAASGILIPKLHKKKNDKFKVSAIGGLDSQAIHLTYTF